MRTSLLASAVLGALAMFAAGRFWSIEGSAEEDDDVTPARPSWEHPQSTLPVNPDAGPVLVTIEYRIDPARAPEFKTLMQHSRRARLRHGALAWELFHDMGEPGHYIEYFIDESWVQHLRRFDRVTAGDVALRERRLAFHIGAEPPKVSRFIAAAAVDGA